MLLEVGMRNFLLAQASLQALVADRVYGLLRPQASALPAVMIQRTGTQRQVLFCGTDSLVQAQVQVDSYGMTGEDVWNLATALRHVLVDFTGAMDLTPVDQCTLENESALTEPDPGIVRVMQLYSVWYVED